MLKKLTLAAVLTLGMFGMPCYGKSITDEKSGVVIDLPDGEGWKLDEGKKMTTAANDEGISVSIVRFDKMMPSTLIKRLADEMVQFMQDAKANADDIDKITVHGMQVDKVSGYGMKDEKPVKFSMILICKDNTSTLAVIAYGGETAFKRHLRDIDAAFDSIRPK